MLMPPSEDRARGVFCNRTLNLRTIRAIGYDMDYTLIHYHVEAWERRAYDYLKASFAEMNWPVEKLIFDPNLVCRGLIVDTQLGNIVKANRFGFIKQAIHGTRKIDFDSLRNQYLRTIVDLNEHRWIFLNTLFSLSEGCMYAQLVDLLDQRKLPEGIGYGELYRLVKEKTDFAHMDGKLKADVIADPDHYVALDSEMPLALLDQKNAGKKLMLITNSEWSYAASMMEYAFSLFLPGGMKWRDLFDVVIVGARKPDFFTTKNPLFEVVTKEGLLAPATKGFRPGAVYYGGSARQVEKFLSLAGDEFLYVGDHMFGDVKVTKDVLRWRTALIIRELEDEVKALEDFHERQNTLTALMVEKEKVEIELSQVRLAILRNELKYGEQSVKSVAELHEILNDRRERIEAMDEEIGPLALAAGRISNHTWGLLMRTGNDKSHLAYQLERYADIYTSRVSNFYHQTPYAYWRSARGTLPHDPQ